MIETGPSYKSYKSRTDFSIGFKHFLSVLFIGFRIGDNRRIAKKRCKQNSNSPFYAVENSVKYIGDA